MEIGKLFQAERKRTASLPFVFARTAAGVMSWTTYLFLLVFLFLFVFLFAEKAVGRFTFSFGIEEMQEIINRFSVFGLTSGDVEQAFTPEQLEAWRNMPVRTAVKCVAAFRDTRDDNNILSYEYAGYYPGTPKEAKADIGPRIAALLRRAPTPEEIRRKGLMGLSDETMQTALNALAPHYWTKDRSAFAERC